MSSGQAVRPKPDRKGRMQVVASRSAMEVSKGSAAKATDDFTDGLLYQGNPPNAVHGSVILSVRLGEVSLLGVVFACDLSGSNGLSSSSTAISAVADSCFRDLSCPLTASSS